MTASLDVHILVLSSTPAAWLAQCIDSAHAAAEQAPFDVRVHLVDGVEGHIGKGRADGFSRGEGRYVTYVDDDDYLLPLAFAELADTLAGNPAAVFTGELQEQNGHLRSSASPHHLAVYRRDVAAGIDFSRWFVCADWAMRRAVDGHPDGVIKLQQFNYVHRMYANSRARRMRIERAQELKELVNG